MLLVVDAGNTQTHLGTFRDDELVQHWRFATIRESTGAELGAAFLDWLNERGLPEARYRDPGRAPAGSPGRIPGDLLAYAEATVAAACSLPGEKNTVVVSSGPG